MRKEQQDHTQPDVLAQIRAYAATIAPERAHMAAIGYVQSLEARDADPSFVRRVKEEFGLTIDTEEASDRPKLS